MTKINSVLAVTLLFLSLNSLTHLPAGMGSEKITKTALGTNLNGPDDWNTEIPFVDIFRLARRWISQQEGAAWGKGPQLSLDSNGWVTSLEPGCRADTLLLTTSGFSPEGIYTLLYEGEGTIEVRGSNAALIDIIETSPGRILFNLTPTPIRGDGSLTISLLETNPDNYIRNIRVLLPGHEDDYQKNPFRPGFIEMWQGFKSLRFMDWMKTNNSTITSWSQRPTLESCTWTLPGGIPIEVMVDLANRQKADPWFCMPHMADDDYIRNFATLVKDTLDPSLRIYIEYSNEVWNSMFTQHKWAGEQGKSLGFGDKPWEAGWRYYARRSMEIFKIWEEVFGGTDRLVRVLSTQSGNAHVARQILSFEDAARHADALAIAPYVGFNIPEKSNKPNALTADFVATWTVEQVMDEIINNRLPIAIQEIQEHKDLANQYGLTLIAYEAGQHAVGISGGENNEQLTDLLHEANRTQAMGDLYEAYYKAWQDAGGALLCQFSSIGRWSKWGSWGLMEYFNSKPSDYPKFISTIRWGKSLGQPVMEISD